MNAKKAKSLRRAVRLNKSERDAQYTPAGHNVMQIGAGTNVNGTQLIRNFYYTGTLTLAPGCGRSLYKRMKERAA